MRNTIYRHEGTLEEWRKVYSSSNLLNVYELFELKEKLVGYDPSRAKHRQKEGSEKVLSQVIVGWDRQLWKFDPDRHKWIAFL